MQSTTHRRFKDSLYEQFARVGKALSAPKRLELLDLLAQAPRTVESLADEAALSVANASQHLKILRGSQLVTAEKKGLFVEYRLATDDVSRFLVALRTLAESRLAEIERVAGAYFESRGSLEPISGHELAQRVRNGDVTVLDVRPVEEFLAGHLPGAISMPLAELRHRLRELPRRREIVAYCRGPYCVFAAEAVEVLRRAGFRAERLEHGVPDWRARGWRVESSPNGAKP